MDILERIEKGEIDLEIYSRNSDRQRVYEDETYNELLRLAKLGADFEKQADEIRQLAYEGYVGCYEKANVNCACIMDRIDEIRKEAKQ